MKISFELDEMPNFRHEYIAHFYNNTVRPVIGTKTEDFCKIIAQFPITEGRGKREKAFVDKMLEHVLLMQEQHPMHAGVYDRLINEADIFHDVMKAKFLQEQFLAKEAVQRLTKFQQECHRIKSNQTLLESMNNHPEFW